ncbi:MAG: thiamine phosphate synthase [Longimicrobiales bacterium]|nr:thiamine phosphate synthase [Longimicrobiales bacterium]
MVPGSSTAIVPGLHVVTDDEILARSDFVELASALLRRGGASMALHVRGPRTAGGALFALAAALAGVARPAGAWLVVNDRVDVALAAGACGVHLGARSLPVASARRLLGGRGRIGASVHSVPEGADAARQGADWIFAGTIWATPSHPGREGRGPGFIAEVRSAAPAVPVLAIGGVSEERVAEVMGGGAAGVAVIRGIWDAPDPLEAARRYLEALAASAGHREERA